MELPPAAPLTCHVTLVLVVLVTVAAKVAPPPSASTLAVVGVTLMATGGAGQPARPVAVAGATLVAAVADTTTSAVSCFPASSVTVRRTVNDPEAGATTVAVEVLAP